MHVLFKLTVLRTLSPPPFFFFFGDPNLYTADSDPATYSLFVDGYISQSFPNGDAESYLCHLLKRNPSALRQSCLALGRSDLSGVLFVVDAVPRTLSSVVRLYMQREDGYPLWLLDHSVVRTGTVVPQTLWSPQNVNDFRLFVSDASLQMPIFFTHANGTLGLSLSDAANGRFKPSVTHASKPSSGER